VQQQTLVAISKLQLRAAGPELRRLVGRDSAAPAVRAEALKVLDAIEDPELLGVAKAAGAADVPAVRLAALPVLARLSPRETLPVVERLIAEGNAAEQQGAFNALDRLKLPEADQLLARALKRLALGEVETAAQFELLDAAEKSPAPEVQALLLRQKEQWAAANDPLAPFRGAIAGGDEDKGSNVFYDHPVMACVRCHKVSGSGGDAGPDLTMVAAQRSPEYVLESIIKPSAHITPGFDVVSLTLQDGTLESGTIQSETADTLMLQRPDGSPLTLPVGQIKTRESAPSSMPEIYAQVLSRAELRDLMAFLLTLDDDEEPAINDGPRALRTGFPDEDGRGDEPTLEDEGTE
jgi:quinoprotein glucose dehydrogenase